MARIKLKLGENEIEVDSRDFYVDNQTLGEIIANISNHIHAINVTHILIIWKGKFLIIVKNVSIRLVRY